MTTSNNAPQSRGTGAQGAKPTSKRARYKANRKAKTADNKNASEGKSKTALVLGGGAPNMALMAGALAAFEDQGVTFDVVSTSGAGAVIGLLWLAPKGMKPRDALGNVVNLSVADPIYQAFPINYKVFNKPGALADLYRETLSSLPGAREILNQYGKSDLERLWSDGLQFMWSCLCPSDLNSGSVGLCARLPFIEHVVDFDNLKHVKPYFYMNAYNVTNEIIDDFSKEEITVDHFRAALAFPFIYGPYELNGCSYYEGAVRDCLNYKDLVEKHPGLETIVVFDVLGSDELIRRPRNLYDSWVLSMIIPLVKTAEDDTDLFAYKHNKGYLRSQGAKTDLLKVTFNIPPAYLAKVLDWSSSNARRLFDIGYDAGKAFAADNHAALARRATPTRRR